VSAAVANWSRLVRFTPARVERPADVAGIVAAVRGSAGGAGLRVVGGAHSFTPLIETEGTLVSLDRFQGVDAVDRAAGRAVVRGGTRLRRLNADLAAAGVALENLGDIDRQSIAGAVSTGTHGTGLSLGSLSTQVEAMELVTGAGEVVECSPDRDPELFRAAQVSLGALGVIARLTLRVVPEYRLRYRRHREPLEECLARLPERRAAHRHLEFYWFPHSDVVQVKVHDPTDEPARPRRVRRLLEGMLVDNLGFGLLCGLCRMRPALSASVSRFFARAAGTGTDVDRSDRVLVSRRLVRFQEMEYSLPVEEAPAALRALKEWIAAERAPVCFPLEFRYVKADEAFLSPSFGRDSAYVAVHAFRGMEFRRYFDAAEAIFRGHGGRPHWGKLHTLGARELAPLYPCWERFQQARRRMDPGGAFLTPYLRRLLDG
jgi:FAD-linked oxidoreductase